MKKLNLPKICCPCIHWHNKIVNGKRNAQIKNNLLSMRRDVGTQYRKFFHAAINNELESVATVNWGANQKVSLRSCYKNRSVVLNDLLASIEFAQRSGTFSKCPYCGITRPSSHDHYLPAEMFPEFSVHALNLIPCCADCNSSKGKKWLKNSTRCFIYFYLDDLPEAQFLCAEVSSKNGGFGASFFLKRPKLVPPKTWMIIESHFAELNLLKRYEKESSDEISSIFETCKAHVMDGGQSAQGLLSQLADGEAEKFGASHWRVVLMRELITSKEFCDEVEHWRG